MVDVIDAPLGDLRAAAASKGTALTTAPAVTAFPPNTGWAQLVARNFATAVVAGVQMCPYGVILKTADKFVTPMIDISEDCQDGSTSTTPDFNSLPTYANGGAIFIGSKQPFRGLIVDVQNTNSNASVLTASYPDGMGGYTSLSASDGTASGGATFAQDGAITWTVPTTGPNGLWKAQTLTEILETSGITTSAKIPYPDERFYWVRLVVSAALDSTVSVNSIHLMNRSTAYAEMIANQVVQFRINRGVGGHSGVLALTDAGTANLIVNVAPAGEWKN